MPFYLKECPRDQGDLYLDKDHYGDFLRCMQCGYQEDVKTPPKPYAPNSFTQTQHNGSQTYLKEVAIDGSSKRRILDDLYSRTRPIKLNEIKKGIGQSEKKIEDDQSEKTIEDHIEDIIDCGYVTVDFRSDGEEQYSISSAGRDIIEHLKYNGSIKEEESEEDSEQVKGNKK